MTRSSRPRHRSLAMVIAAVLAVVAAGCNASGSAGPASVGPTQLRSLEVQAKIPVRDAFDILSAFGSLWVVSNGSGSIVRIDPASNAIVAKIPVSTFIAGLAPSDDGLWVIDGDARAVRRIDPATNKLTADSIAIGDDGGSLQFAKGALWQSGRGSAQRIDLGAKKADASFSLGACDDCGFVILGDAGYALGGHAISRIDLTSHKLVATNDADISGQLVGVGAAGLWMGGVNGGVVLLDPQSLKVLKTFTTGPATGNGGTWSLGTAGENGGISADDAGAWVRFSGPVLGHVKATGGIDLFGPYPPTAFGASGFTIANGSIWITNTGGAPGSDETGSVWRLALPTP
jgi:hypothetical protein